MSEIILPRRKFLMGMAGLLAAPAIVRIESLMAVRSLISPYPFDELKALLFEAENEILNRTIYVRLPNNYQFLDTNILRKNG